MSSAAVVIGALRAKQTFGLIRLIAAAFGRTHEIERKRKNKKKCILSLYYCAQFLECCEMI